MLSRAGRHSQSRAMAEVSASWCRSDSAGGSCRESSSRPCRAAHRPSTRRRSGRIRKRPPNRPAAHMTISSTQRGLADTNILILRTSIDPDELPEELAISAITLAELSAGPHEVRSDDEQDLYFESSERARRLDILQRAEHEFDPIPFDAEAARAYGRVVAAVLAAGRKPRRRVADLMIAATAVASDLPLYTTNPDDFIGLSRLLAVVRVTRPTVRSERQG
jgi:predicted nucleic acid-binding protein